MPNALECVQLSKAFSESPAVRDVSLQLGAGEFLSLLGPSGCGKTTVLRLVAGFEQPDAGSIWLNGQVIADSKSVTSPETRKIGMVFQEYAIFPHLNVVDNVSFGLSGPQRQKRKEAAPLLDLVGLTGLEDRMPHELSGGQQQRVALARALAPQPEIVLLDEPFSNLDAALRGQVRREVRDILREAGMAAIFVTHDQEEALSMSDRVAVMFDGRILQDGSPQDLYLRPTTRRVASFLGETNFLPALANGDHATSVIGEVALLQPTNGEVDLLIRPEFLHLQAPAPDSPAGLVRWVEFFGHHQRIGVELDDGQVVVVRAGSRHRFVADQRVSVLLDRPVLAFAQ